MSSVIKDNHDDAIAKAQEVVRSIRAGAFEPTGTQPVSEDPLAMIYRVQSVGSSAEAEGDE